MSRSGIERRRLKRFAKRVPVYFQCGVFRGAGRIKNISKEGLFVRSAVLPEPGDRVRIMLESSDGSKLEFRGEVRWTTAQLPPGPTVQPGFGVLIEDVEFGYLEFFEDMLLH